MGRRTVRHAVFTWPNPAVEGAEHIAFRGAVIDLTDEAEERADAIGALEPHDFVTAHGSQDYAEELAAEALQPEPPDAAIPTGRPRRISPKSAWVAWAVSQGASAEEAESTSKEDLISLYGG